MANTKPGAESEGTHYVTYKALWAGVGAIIVANFVVGQMQSNAIDSAVQGVEARHQSAMIAIEKSWSARHEQAIEEMRMIRQALLANLRSDNRVSQNNSQQVVIGSTEIDTLRQKEWLNSTELAAIEGVTRDTIYRRKDEGRYVWKIEHGQYCFLNPQYPTTRATSMVRASNGHDSGTEN